MLINDCYRMPACYSVYHAIVFINIVLYYYYYVTSL